jgi:hypothetical protein
MKTIRSIYSLVLSVFAATLPVRAEEFLPIIRAGVLDLFKPDNIQQILISDEKATPDIKQLRARSDSVWLANDVSSQARIAMAGEGDKIHTIRIMVAVVNNSEQQNNHVFASLSALFPSSIRIGSRRRIGRCGALIRLGLPQPGKWTPRPKRGTPSGGNLDDLIPFKRVGGITASTFGVPPDLVVYAITTRDECIPKRADNKASPQDDPIRRPIC